MYPCPVAKGVYIGTLNKMIYFSDKSRGGSTPLAKVRMTLSYILVLRVGKQEERPGQEV